ncbi:hypothetical protein NA78x_004788 [Anatilimnocola sp. NA78]|uniref:hypothetical protein n=1 Tax=Anatilimnocola sp. NA78 TaxID=3415683 RepID=UPI003CE4AD24
MIASMNSSAEWLSNGYRAGEVITVCVRRNAMKRNGLRRNEWLEKSREKVIKNGYQS